VAYLFIVWFLSVTLKIYEKCSTHRTSSIQASPQRNGSAIAEELHDAPCILHTNKRCYGLLSYSLAMCDRQTDGWTDGHWITTYTAMCKCVARCFTGSKMSVENYVNAQVQHTVGVAIASLVAWTKLGYSTLSPVSTGMGDRLCAGIPPWYVTKPTRPTQPCIPSLNLVQALTDQGKGENVTCADGR